MISHRCDTGTLRETAIAEGMHTLRESARRLVLEGTTSSARCSASALKMWRKNHPWRTAHDRPGNMIHDALERNASDIHLTVGEPPIFRLDGELTDVGETPLTEEDTDAYVRELVAPGLLEEFRAKGEADFAVTYHDLVRMRCNVFRQRGMTSLALRLLPLRIATAGSGLPPVVVAQAVDPRTGARHRPHRLGQKLHSGGAARPHRPHRAPPHHHAGGTHRIPAHERSMYHQPARGGR